MALLQISHGLSRRLVATVAATLMEQPDPVHNSVLHAAVYGRVLAGLTRWVGNPSELDLQIVARSARPALSRASEHRYTAQLPLEWLIDVWARELTHTGDGEFTLSATPLPAGGSELTTVDRDLSVHTRIGVA